jgi:hypothetical protein
MLALIAAGFDFTVFLSLMIPIIAIVMGILLTICIIYLDYRKRRETLELFHKERLAAIDKGLDVPPWPAALLGEGRSAASVRNPRRALLKGLIWLFLGVAVGIFLKAQNGDASPTMGLIGVAIGLAYLIYYAVEGRRTPPPTSVDAPRT